MMATDWNLIREMMSTAIDSCERIEQLGYSEYDRDTHVDVNGNPVSLHEFMVSAWTYPENLRYQIIRQRHDNDANAPYVQEATRIVTAMAAACGELINAADTAPAKEEIRQMLRWYREHALPNIEQAMKVV
jgi:hypothetical protein